MSRRRILKSTSKNLVLSRPLNRPTVPRAIGATSKAIRTIRHCLVAFDTLKYPVSSCCRPSVEDHIPFACIEHSPLTPCSLAQLKEPGAKSLRLGYLQRDFSLLLAVDILAGLEVTTSFVLRGNKELGPSGGDHSLPRNVGKKPRLPLIRKAGH